MPSLEQTKTRLEKVNRAIENCQYPDKREQLIKSLGVLLYDIDRRGMLEQEISKLSDPVPKKKTAKKKTAKK